MTEIAVLTVAALVSSIISGTIGMAGGIILLAVMANFFAPSTLIPLHGAVQLASNSSRAFINREYLEWTIIRRFAVGGLVGALAGVYFVVAIPEEIFALVISSFILFVTWVPRPKQLKGFRGKWWVLGGTGTFLSLFVGATGPLLAPFFLKKELTKEIIVATKAGCQVFIHTLKLAVFFYHGLDLTPHLPLLAFLIPAVFLGNWIGKFFLHCLDEKYFRPIFKSLITLLAIRLLWKAYF